MGGGGGRGGEERKKKGGKGKMQRSRWAAIETQQASHRVALSGWIESLWCSHPLPCQASVRLSLPEPACVLFVSLFAGRNETGGYILLVWCSVRVSVVWCGGGVCMCMCSVV